MIPRDESWVQQNRQHLLASLARIRAALGPATADAAAPTAAESAAADSAATMTEPAAIDVLADVFGLSRFERLVLLLCAGVELDSGLARACAERQHMPHAGPSFSLAMAVLPGAHWSAITPLAPLRRFRLVEAAGNDGDALLTTARIRITERVLHFLVGIDSIDEGLRGLVEPVPAAAVLPPSQQAALRQIHSAWDELGPGAIVQLAGTDAAGRAGVAAAACAVRGMRLFALRPADLPAAPAERDACVRLWQREALLLHSALLVAAEPGEPPATLAALLRSLGGCLLVTAAARPDVPGRSVVRIDVDRPLRSEQAVLWRQQLGALAADLNGELDQVAGHFDLAGDQIAAVGHQLRLPREEPVGQRLWRACRQVTRGALDELAQRLEPTAAWNDLVLPAPQRQSLREIAAQVRHRTLVYEQWHLARKETRGLGITALFAGQSGTGKTMAAEVLAGELGLDLYRVDLSQVVSKYIGETEKNLRRVFDAAEASGVVLLFDEADALFGKRSEVKDSHDRYANVEVSYLLQRMESYRGLAILTTNMRSALDGAFLRRLRFVVEFPFPDSAQREQIWRRVYPEAAPVAELDTARLARLNVAGGSIRNIAVQAAFLAAAAGEPIAMRHLLSAARSEYLKLDKKLGAEAPVA